jgi:hypothetical protein
MRFLFVWDLFGVSIRLAKVLSISEPLFWVQLSQSKLFLESTNHFNAWSGEDFLKVRRVRQLGGEILAGEVELLVHVGPPLGTIAYIIDDAVEGDQLWGAAFPGAAAQFHLCDDAVRDVHGWDYTGIHVCPKIGK